MPDTGLAPAIESNAPKAIENELCQNSREVEELSKLIYLDRLQLNKEKILKEYKELRERQQRVKEMHDIQQAINAATKNGELDVTGNEKLKELLQKAKELGVDIDPTKMKYSKDERIALVENIRLSIDDLNIENEMQLKAIGELQTRGNEIIQLIAQILKRLDDAKKRYNQGISSR